MKRKKLKNGHNPGATPPASSDDVSIQIGVTANAIVLTFQRPIPRLVLNAEAARGLAALFFRHAAEIEVASKLSADVSIQALKAEIDEIKAKLPAK